MWMTTQWIDWADAGGSLTWKWESYLIAISCFLDRYEIHIQDFWDFINACFIISDPHLHKSWYKWGTDFCLQKAVNRLSNKFKTKTHILIPIFTKLICCRDAPIFFLYLLKYFGNKYGLRGSRFCENVCRSINVLQSIATDRESLIRDFGIITPP